MCKIFLRKEESLCYPHRGWRGYHARSLYLVNDSSPEVTAHMDSAAKSLVEGADTICRQEQNT